MMKKIIATITMFLAMVAGVAMYLSSRFVPIYVNGEYILANQILRYVLYIILIVIALCSVSFVLSDEQPKKKHHRRRR